MHLWYIILDLYYCWVPYTLFNDGDQVNGCNTTAACLQWTCAYSKRSCAPPRMAISLRQPLTCQTHLVVCDANTLSSKTTENISSIQKSKPLIKTSKKFLCDLNFLIKNKHLFTIYKWKSGLLDSCLKVGCPSRSPCQCQHCRQGLLEYHIYDCHVKWSDQ